MFILIPGSVIDTISTIFTFPGVIVHEFAHRFFCDILQVPVYDTCYFKMDKSRTRGYVIHEHEKNIRDAFLISLAPLIINTILSAVLMLPGIIQMFVLDIDRPTFGLLFLLWVGFTVGLRAIPSDVDTDGLMNSLTRLEASKSTVVIAKIIGYVCSILRCIFGSILPILGIYWLYWRLII